MGGGDPTHQSLLKYHRPVGCRPENRRVSMRVTFGLQSLVMFFKQTIGI